MSQYGEQLDLPLEGQGEALCQHTGERYVLEGKQLRRIAS
jgi:UDP-2-acetamido-3-amino-2,3-dideoxy-glucuronate N-acetyltransferase